MSEDEMWADIAARLVNDISVEGETFDIDGPDDRKEVVFAAPY